MRCGRWEPCEASRMHGRLKAGGHASTRGTRGRTWHLESLGRSQALTNRGPSTLPSDGVLLHLADFAGLIVVLALEQLVLLLEILTTLLCLKLLLPKCIGLCENIARCVSSMRQVESMGADGLESVCGVVFSPCICSLYI